MANLLNIQQTIEQLSNNPRISKIDIFGNEQNPLVSIQFTDKYRQMHETSLDADNMFLLLDGFTLSSIGNFQYIRLKSENKYLHQAILPVDANYVVHHTAGTLCNIRESLVAMPRDEHSRLHRLQRVQQTLPC